MAKYETYSTDTRQRVLASIATTGRVRQAAARFAIPLGTVKHWRQVALQGPSVPGSRSGRPAPTVLALTPTAGPEPAPPGTGTPPPATGEARAELFVRHGDGGFGTVWQCAPSCRPVAA
jgi:transposase-like protein